MIADFSQTRVVILSRENDQSIARIAGVIRDAGGESVITQDLDTLEKATAPDAVLVDVRVDSYPALLNVVDLPIIALINSDQSANSLSALPYVDDIISVDTSSDALVQLRIQRQLDRFRNPIASMQRNAPEFNLVKILVNTTNDQIYVKDLDHRFLFASNVFAESNGRSIDDIIGKDDIEIGSNPIDVLGSDELGWLGFWAQDDAAVASGYRTREENPEWRAILEDTKQNRVYRVPLKNNRGEVCALVVVSSNISPSDSNVVDIKARGVILDRALGAMKRAQESREIAERAVMEKNKLLAAASHDLRQPLHAMGLFLDVLERRLAGEQELGLIAKIKRSSNALSVLFNSLLDISRLDAGVVNVSREHFPLETLLIALRSEFQEIGSQKNLTVDIQPCEKTIHTDPILFERILRNLIQNAVTYTEEGSVLVKCESTQAELLLSVIDTGPGIPPEEHSEIFSEYYQIEQRDGASTKGLGLGLAIVKRLANLLELEISLSSEVDKGSTFSVTIPLGEYARADSTRVIAGDYNLDGQTIVVIDDEHDILEGMASVLMNYNCAFITAESAEEALAILIDRDIVPDIVVADYRLKNGLTGDQAITDIREEFSLDIPAIIVTGDTSADRLKDATRGGCRLLHKPVSPDDLIRTVSEILSTAEEKTADELPS